MVVERAGRTTCFHGGCGVHECGRGFFGGKGVGGVAGDKEGFMRLLGDEKVVDRLDGSAQVGAVRICFWIAGTALYTKVSERHLEPGEFCEALLRDLSQE